ncbi:MAG: hypothetical protein NVS4B3_26130 [Gemmatimonadaceae bacterium]
MKPLTGDSHAPGTHVPVNTSQGWGIAAGIVLLAAACALFAWYRHNATYHDPQDPTHAARPAAVFIAVDPA